MVLRKYKTFVETKLLTLKVLHFNSVMGFLCMCYLCKKLLICQSEYVGDSRGFVVQTDAGQQQQKGWRGRPSLVSRALTKLARRLAHKLYEAHHQALSYTLAAEFTL